MKIYIVTAGTNHVLKIACDYIAKWKVEGELL